MKNYNLVWDLRPRGIKISRFKRMVYSIAVLRCKKSLLCERCMELLDVYFQGISFSSFSTSEVHCIKMTSLVQYLYNLTIDIISIDRNLCLTLKLRLWEESWAVWINSYQTPRKKLIWLLRNPYLCFAAVDDGTFQRRVNEKDFAVKKDQWVKNPGLVI